MAGRDEGIGQAPIEHGDNPWILEHVKFIHDYTYPVGISAEVILHQNPTSAENLQPMYPVCLVTHLSAARSARCRHHGGPCCLTAESSRFLAGQATGPWHIRWPAPQTCRHSSQ